MRHQSASERFRWLLTDLCGQMGFCDAIREQDRLEALVQSGPEALADEVMRCEGLVPEYNKALRRSLQAFISERFAKWEELDAARGRSLSPR